jgi:catechol-2,3-dioxygenase
MKLKLAVVSLWAADVQEMSDFYKNVLELPLLSVDRGRPHFDFGNGSLVILPGQAHKPQDSVQSRFPVIAFAVDDLQEAIQRLQSYKIKMPWGVEQDHDSRWVMFYDPGGNLIEMAMFGHRQHQL